MHLKTYKTVVETSRSKDVIQSMSSSHWLSLQDKVYAAKDSATLAMLPQRSFCAYLRPRMRIPNRLCTAQACLKWVNYTPDKISQSLVSNSLLHIKWHRVVLLGSGLSLENAWCFCGGNAATQPAKAYFRGGNSFHLLSKNDSNPNPDPNRHLRGQFIVSDAFWTRINLVGKVCPIDNSAILRCFQAACAAHAQKVTAAEERFSFILRRHLPRHKIYP